MTREEARKAAENINLCKILTNCPKGTKFYSKIHGNVVLYRVDYNREFLDNGIFYECSPNDEVVFIPEDKLYDRDKGEYILLPAKDQPDWRKWEYFKNPKFDPKTLQPFDRVLVKTKYASWKCGLFSNINDEDSEYKYYCIGGDYVYCIPYNDDTKHLIGTNEEAPEYYRYWED